MRSPERYLFIVVGGCIHRESKTAGRGTGCSGNVMGMGLYFKSIMVIIHRENYLYLKKQQRVKKQANSFITLLIRLFIHSFKK